MFRHIIFILSVLLFVHTTVPAWTASPALIRDAEVETTIRSYARPLFRAAGLNAQNVEIYIVKDKARNAFVTGGQKLFINSGLIIDADNVNQIIGVIAHETGHIAGGHLSRLEGTFSRISATSILSLILGGAATIATSRSDIGKAIVAGGEAVAQRSFLSYSRVQEAAADIAALKLLDKTNQSAEGLLKFLKKLSGQELLSPTQQNPYIRSHPLTRNRIATITRHVANSPHSGKPIVRKLFDTHERIKAKLFAFIKPAEQTLRVYKNSDNAIHSRYAQAIAYFRQRKLDYALPIMDGLISEDPNNPFFHELKGQMLFENARIVEALSSYTNASNLFPNSALIRRDLARVQLELGGPKYLDFAIKNLKASAAIEPRSAFNWHLLAIAHGRNGDLGRSSVALAEEALIRGKPKIAEFHAERVQKLFSQGEREWLIAEDIRLAAKDLAVRKRRAK